MKIEDIRCDGGCLQQLHAKNVNLTNWLVVRFYDEDMPARLRNAGIDYDAEYHFCSWKCLHVFTTENVAT